VVRYRPPHGEDPVNLEVALERITPTRARWDAWTQREPALVDLAYHDLRSELRAATQSRQDELLGALVRLVQADPRAFGVLATCLLPGLRHRIVRRAPSLDRQEALAVMVGALYEAVVRYDTAQHDLYVAENLLALPTRRLRRAVVAHRTWSDHAQHNDDVAPHERGPELSPGALLGSAVDAKVLTEQDARLIFDTRIAGRTLPEVARRIGLHYDAAKKRRQRAEAAWAAWWAPEACRRRERA
jgi:hypothetical protein